MAANILLCKTREAFSTRQSNESTLRVLRSTAPAVMPPYMAALSSTPRAHSPPLEFVVKSDELNVEHEALYIISFIFCTLALHYHEV